MHPESNTNKYLKLHFIIFIWGFTAVLGALISLEAIPLVWYRLGLAIPILFIWLIIKKYPIKVSRKSLLNFLIGGLIIGLHWVGFFMAIKVANVSVTLVTLSTGAFFASLLEPLFFRRKIRFLEVLFGILIIGGLYIIFRVDSFYIYGMLWALLAAFLSALFSVINGLMVTKHNGYVLSLYQLFFGFLGITVYLLLTNGFTVEFFNLSGKDWLYLFILSSICTAYAFAESIELMKKISPFTIMLSINLEPVYGILLALIVFGKKEYMGSQFYLGTFIILSLVIINSILKTRLKQ